MNALVAILGCCALALLLFGCAGSRERAAGSGLGDAEVSIGQAGSDADALPGADLIPGEGDVDSLLDDADVAEVLDADLISMEDVIEEP